MVTVERRPLAANEPYIQPGRDRFEGNEPIGGIRGLVYASHAGTLYLEESDDDGATWSQTGAAVLVAAKTTTPLPWTALTKQQYRFRYVNGATAQTKFRLVQQTRGMDLVDMQLSGSILVEQKTQADAVANVITFTENISTIEVYHAEATWQTFTVNGLTLTIPAGGYRTPIGGITAKTVTIPAGINCIVGRLL